MSTQKILILGGGTGGISIAAKLRRLGIPPHAITIVEPSSKHYYQPLWTLVGAGVVNRSATERNEADLIPAGVHWIQERVTRVDPKGQVVMTASGRELTYDFLIVAVGLQLQWEKIDGLAETLGKNGVCSNYSYEHVDYTWECIRNFRGGRALFTQPIPPIKCAGAPQKIMYLAEHAFRRQRVRGQAQIEFFSAAPSIFAVKKYADALTVILKLRKIETHFRHSLVAIDGPKRRARFLNLETGSMDESSFELLHVVPPMAAPAFIADSGLGNAAGYVDVDRATLRHVTYGNIFSLGDCSSLPTSKTGAAIRKQYPILAENLISVMEKRPPQRLYDGYTSCPLVTGYGRLILAEFDYDNKPMETFPFNQAKERLSMYLLKKYVLPVMYWFGMLRGRF